MKRHNITTIDAIWYFGWVVLLAAITFFSVFHEGTDWACMSSIEKATVLTAGCSVIATFVAAFMAWYGPTVSVRIAHQMMEEENKKLEAAKLFREITHDIEVFKTSVKDAIVSMGNAILAHERLEMLDQDPESRDKDYSRELRQREIINEWTERAVNSVLEYRSILKADKMAIRLLFGKDGFECEKAIDVVIRLGDKLPPFNKETIEDDMHPFAIANAKVIEEMEKIFKRLTRSPRISHSESN